MYLALDIGTEYTYIACWEEAQSVEDASLKVRIPGLGIHQSHATSLDRQNWAEHIGFIFREYLLPTRRPISSASVALPGIPDLTSRRMLLDVFEEVMGLAEVEIVARPLGLLSGWSRDLTQLLVGDVMQLEVQGPILSASFLSTFVDGRIILEKTVQGSWEEIENAGREADFHSGSGWNLDYILITGEGPDSIDLTRLTARFDNHASVLQVSDPGWKTIAGLYQRKASRKNSSWYMIYPYDFYVENKLSNCSSSIKLAFDTTNLELSVDGSYLLAGIDPSQYCGGNDTSRVKVSISEVPSSQSFSNINMDSQQLVLDIDSNLEDLPDILNLRLNLRSAILSLELPEESGLDAASLQSPLPDLAQNNLKNLYQELEAKTDVLDLRQAFHTFNNYYPADLNLAEEVQFCLFHLYGLLAIYSL